VISTVTDAGLILQATIEYQLVDDALMTALLPLDSDNDSAFNLFDVNRDGDFQDAQERDNCWLIFNPDQKDTDHDTLGDVCDDDDDSDTIPDVSDNCRLAPNPDQANVDGDTAGDSCDRDNDNDGFADAYELRVGSNPASSASTPEVCDGIDNDVDTQTDEGFPDSDGDGIKDCLEANVDSDGDTLLNSTDADDDNDGFSDSVETYAGTDSLDACPDNSNDDAWPVDINMDTRVSIVDVLRFRPVILTQIGDPNYDKRFDLNADGAVGIVDVLLFKPAINTQCN
jgi:hypothetical protein